jgi:hypothetical protein
MTDRTTKVLLILIALGLWTNITLSLIRPAQANAQDSTMSSINNHVAQIDHDVYNNLSDMASDLSDIKDSASAIKDGVSALRRGGANCLNSKICD